MKEYGFTAPALSACRQRHSLISMRWKRIVSLHDVLVPVAGEGLEAQVCLQRRHTGVSVGPGW